MNITDKVLRFLCTKHFTRKGIRVYKPCMYYVHPKANVKIDNYLNFNRQWVVSGVPAKVIANNVSWNW